MKLKKLTLYWWFKRKKRKSNIRTEGHSQYGQDLYVLDLLKDHNNGTFIDIGANDGVTFSNSLLFEKLGWTGVCIEPHPIVFNKLKKERNCHLLNACISKEDGSVNFKVVEGHSNMLSGILEFMDQAHLLRIDKETKQDGGKTYTQEIESVSPKALLQKFSFERISFLSIDTEGCEMQILQTFDFKSTQVDVISIENGSRTDEIFRYLSASGYTLEVCVGCDEIYVRDK